MERWTEAGRVVARIAPHLFVANLQALEVTIAALSTAREEFIG